MEHRKILLLVILISFSFACAVVSAPDTATPEILGPPPPTEVEIILQRLQVDYFGQDGHRVIGSGCPGNDGRGSIENYHFVVNGVDTDRTVERVAVVGDNSTLTWEWPCNDAWGLLAKDAGNEQWDIFIAPSLSTRMYTIIFFYDDHTMALGMVETGR